jgi:hypothetical protein
MQQKEILIRERGDSAREKEELLRKRDGLTKEGDGLMRPTKKFEIRQVEDAS